METLDEGTLAGFRKAFLCFSRTVHGEDLVGAPEMLSVLRALGVSTATEGDAVDLISLVDTAGCAALDFEQFVTVMCSVDLRDGDAGAELQEAFAWADADRDGRIGGADVIAAVGRGMSAVGAEEAAVLVSDLTAGGGGGGAAAGGTRQLRRRRSSAGGLGAALTGTTGSVASGLAGGAAAEMGADFADFARFMQAQYALEQA